MELSAYRNNFNLVCNLINQGRAISHLTKFEAYEYIYNNFCLCDMEIVSIGYEYPNFNLKEETFYRIGEPIIDFGMFYKCSYNYADDRQERGVSVVSKEWLHSFKSIFFGTSDADLKNKGIYKIKGIKLPIKGGDNEPLIIPTDWAEKTKICTRSALERVVK